MSTQHLYLNILRSTINNSQTKPLRYSTSHILSDICVILPIDTSTFLVITLDLDYI